MTVQRYSEKEVKEVMFVDTIIVHEGIPIIRYYFFLVLLARTATIFMFIIIQ
jgi:hypothetical protein